MLYEYVSYNSEQISVKLVIAPAAVFSVTI